MRFYEETLYWQRELSPLSSATSVSGKTLCDIIKNDNSSKQINMANPKEILVLTTSSLEGIKIKKHLKPVSAHIVAGTNLFSDFFGGITDVFGGRSDTYQKQLTSLYNEAIEKIKHATFEIGGNCVIGLSIDLDEISGKGKSMFMITAVGTAIIIEKEEIQKNTLFNSGVKSENVGFEKVNTLRKKKILLQKADAGELSLDTETWDFIISNHVEEIFPYLLKKMSATIANSISYPDALPKFNNQFINYLESFEESLKLDLLYNAIKTEKNSIAQNLSKIILDLNLYDFDRSMQLLKEEEFNIQKIGLKIVSYDKAFYSEQDIKDIQNIIDFIKSSFEERGTRSTKKQLLSSKEKDVWTCECSKQNNTEDYCGNCNKDIYGFFQNETDPNKTANFLEQKIELIKELIK